MLTDTFGFYTRKSVRDHGSQADAAGFGCVLPPPNSHIAMITKRRGAGPARGGWVRGAGDWAGRARAGERRGRGGGGRRGGGGAQRRWWGGGGAGGEGLGPPPPPPLRGSRPGGWRRPPPRRCR